MRAASVLLLLALVAGCGGGNSQEDFAQDAVAICEESNDRVKALGTPDSFPTTQLYARQAKDAVGDEIDELRTLTPPDDLEEAFDQYLATLEQRQAQLELLVQAADENDGDAVQDVGTALDALTTRARAQARRAAIGACEPG